MSTPEEAIGSLANPADVVIVGGGPRAIAVLERLTARLGDDAVVRVAVIDAVEVGAGSTWRTDQRAEFLNNTYAGHTTIYPDASTPMAGPITSGPDLATWAKGVATGRLSAPTDVAPRPDWLPGEVAALRPWHYPSRRLQGVYYREQLAAILARGGVDMRAIRGIAIDVSPASANHLGPASANQTGAEGLRLVRLADGTAVVGRIVILAQGMVQALPDAATRRFQAAAGSGGLFYLPPGMPSERNWDAVPAGKEVLVAGLGANFFDVLAVLTVGRGGRVVEGRRPFEFNYVPSGREPHLIAGSPRGLPYRSKSHHAGFPPAYVPQLATPSWFVSRERLSGLNFRADIWPQVARELVVAQLATLAEHHPAAVPDIVFDGPGRGAAWALPAEILCEIAHCPADGLGEIVARYVIPADRRQDPARLDRPNFESGGDWATYVARWAGEEWESIAAPLTSPRAAVNRAMAYLRSRVFELVAAGAIGSASVLRDVNGWFLRLNIALASGPPPERTALLLALIRAGVVELLGEGSRFDIGSGAAGVVFSGVSEVTGRRFETRALIETRMSKGEVDITDDPLLRSLLDSGRARLLRVPDGPHRAVEARTLDVDHDTFALVDARGLRDSRVLVVGIPAGDVQPGSGIGATPGVRSPLIGGADRVAAGALSQLRAGPSYSVSQRAS